MNGRRSIHWGSSAGGSNFRIGSFFGRFAVVLPSSSLAWKTGSYWSDCFDPTDSSICADTAAAAPQPKYVRGLLPATPTVPALSDWSDGFRDPLCTGFPP